MKPALLFVLMFFLACASSRSDKSEKLDAPLRLKVETAEKSASEEPIQVLGKCSQPISEEMRSQLEASGATIHTVTGDIFTATGTARQIRELARHDYVIQLALSVERKY
ncbi:MAG: hypothetical protein HUU32_11975 [Calditrichaceae bacterium]|nr:hypothetical protein [Calditrichia bacterium]NUQ42107.1 hypothetical protein [Calditrichaceae bacterium]